MKESPVHELRIGCIADDFTGGGDAASFLAGGGLKTLLLIWPFSCEHLPEDCDAVVIALKSRSVPADQAVADSLAAINWLQAHHVRKLYFKYCSTFDSTPRGNIGPVSDALLETLEQPYTVLCPSLLSNGRAVRDGVLYVNGIPLAQSPMRSHPLNPMWDSDIRVLMQAQSRYPCFVVPEALCRDPAALAGRIHALQQKHRHFYLIPDYFEPTHGAEIARAFAPLPLWTGGSELLLHFARQVSGGAAGASLVPPFCRTDFCIRRRRLHPLPDGQRDAGAFFVSGPGRQQAGRPAPGNSHSVFLYSGVAGCRTPGGKSTLCGEKAGRAGFDRYRKYRFYCISFQFRAGTFPHMCRFAQKYDLEKTTLYELSF